MHFYLKEHLCGIILLSHLLAGVKAVDRQVHGGEDVGGQVGRHVDVQGLWAQGARQLDVREASLVLGKFVLRLLSTQHKGSSLGPLTLDYHLLWFRPIMLVVSQDEVSLHCLNIV